MWGASLTFPTPMLFSVGFLLTFLIGGLSGVMLVAAPLDFHFQDSYFLVAHFHYTLFGAVVFGAFAAIYYWWPKMTGRMLGERLGKLHFWLTFVGFQITFFVQHILGIRGMPRRVSDYTERDGFGFLNVVSTAGSFVHAVGPEDREDAEIADGAGTIGFFSAGSIWPLAVGLSAALASTAALFAPLTAVAGVVLLVGAALGLATEHWRLPR